MRSAAELHADLAAELAMSIEGGVTFRPPVLIVAAHPDDETIGAGGLLQRLVQGCVLHVTDGAPHDLRLVPSGFRHDAASYAATRRREALRALHLAELGPERVLALGGRDQEAMRALVPLSRRLAEFFAETRPAVVITHPYEGGHPDHDAVAFACHAAVGLVGLRGGWAPLLVEMTSYHIGPRAEWVTGEFLPNGGYEWELVLGLQERLRKRAMLDCYASQADVLVAFTTTRERFRPAPRYDFTAPPHPGRLWYEQIGWSGATERFVALASKARRELRLSSAGASAASHR